MKATFSSTLHPTTLLSKLACFTHPRATRAKKVWATLISQRTFMSLKPMNLLGTTFMITSRANTSKHLSLWPNKNNKQKNLPKLPMVQRANMFMLSSFLSLKKPLLSSKNFLRLAPTLSCWSLILTTKPSNCSLPKIPPSILSLLLSLLTHLALLCSSMITNLKVLPPRPTFLSILVQSRQKSKPKCSTRLSRPLLLTVSVSLVSRLMVRLKSLTPKIWTLPS
mmetsp:Transcript_21116/g.31433  ORF Transcript_21116/g.31433 Transcript_21116/m.31433 type:complete len:223 (-) Transcript_21116:149-817(-)